MKKSSLISICLERESYIDFKKAQTIKCNGESFLCLSLFQQSQTIMMS